MDALDVSSRQTLTLPDGEGRDDGRLVPDGEPACAVVHDAAVVVGSNRTPVSSRLVEVVLHTALNLREVDVDELITVVSCLLVRKTHGVSNLVDGCAKTTAVGEVDLVLTCAGVHSDRGVALAVVRDEHEMVAAAGSAATVKADARLRLPVRDGLKDNRVVGLEGVAGRVRGVRAAGLNRPVDLAKRPQIRLTVDSSRAQCLTVTANRHLDIALKNHVLMSSNISVACLSQYCCRKQQHRGHYKKRREKNNLQFNVTFC